MRNKILGLIIGAIIFIGLEIFYGKAMQHEVFSKDPQQFLKIGILFGSLNIIIQYRLKLMKIGSIKFWFFIELVLFLLYKLFKIS